MIALETIDNKDLKELAKDILYTFKAIADRASEEVNKSRDAYSSNVMANCNLFKDDSGQRELQRIIQDNHNKYKILTIEPAVSRVVTIDEFGNSKTYYVCRGLPVTTLDKRFTLTSYKSQLGTLASLNIGDTINVNINNKPIEHELVEKALLSPIKINNNWDSNKTVIYTQDKWTLKSLLDLLKDEIHEDHLDILSKMLAEESQTLAITRGISKDILEKMTLRDLAVLDKEQNKIFRLPLNSQIFLSGPPGTGKTTTLIKRIGQKIEKEFLSDEELLLFRDDESHTRHSKSWIMFTPTELLKLYVKEAFQKEDISAPESQICTWEDFSYKNRDCFYIQKSIKNKNGFKISINDNKNSTSRELIDEYESISYWISSYFAEEYLNSITYLSQGDSDFSLNIKNFIKKYKISSTSSPYEIISLSHQLAEDARKSSKDAKEKVQTIIKEYINIQLNKDSKFIQNFATFEAETLLKDTEDGQDEIEDELEDSATIPQAPIKKALETIGKAIRTLAKNRAEGHSISKDSKHFKILSWLGDRIPTTENLTSLGELFKHQQHTNRLTSLVKYYFKLTPAAYRAYKETTTPSTERINLKEVRPEEADILTLLHLETAAKLLKRSDVSNRLDEGYFSPLKPINDLMRHQVVVDEATDFSAIQLACMKKICSPGFDSFFACGDYNQRITSFGISSDSELMWSIPQIQSQTIKTTYRQSEKLSHFSKSLLSSDIPTKNSDTTPAPAIGINLSSHDSSTSWIADRILEIQTTLSQLPTIAVLVTCEEDVDTVTKLLSERLSEQGVQVSASNYGKSLGIEERVRVFNYEHIKGLEFEAVFFVDIDKLELIAPDLYIQYLYVGATRAASYLGITCSTVNLPIKIEHLKDLFVQSWTEIS